MTDPCVIQLFYSSHGQEKSTLIVKNIVFLVLGAKLFMEKQPLEGSGGLPFWSVAEKKEIIRRPLLLAVRAVHGGATCHLDFFKGASTGLAGLTVAAIDGKTVLESAHIAVGIAVIAYGAAALRYGKLQHILETA